MECYVPMNEPNSTLPHSVANVAIYWTNLRIAYMTPD